MWIFVEWEVGGWWSWVGQAGYIRGGKNSHEDTV